VGFLVVDEGQEGGELQVNVIVEFGVGFSEIRGGGDSVLNNVQGNHVVSEVVGHVTELTRLVTV